MLGHVDRESCQISKSGFESHTRGDYEENEKTILIEPEECKECKEFLRRGIENIPKTKFSILKGQLKPPDKDKFGELVEQMRSISIQKQKLINKITGNLKMHQGSLNWH